VTAVFAVIDVETTGLSPRTERVLELAIVRTDLAGRTVDEWVTRFNPEGPVGATHVHGITDDDVVDAPLFRDVAGEVVDRLRGLTVVAHNAAFDTAFLSNELARAGWDVPPVPAVCTLQASNMLLPHLPRHRLGDVCAAIGVTLEDAHSALGDARAAAALLGHFASGPHAPVTLPTLTQVALDGASVVWPSTASRPHVAAPVRAQAFGTAPKPSPLVRRVKDLPISAMVDEGAPEGVITYLEALCWAFEDGEISAAETDVLLDLVQVYRYSPGDVASAHRTFVTALAYCALDDGHVSRAERDELNRVATALDVPADLIPDLLAVAENERTATIHAGLRPLPDSWDLGVPLHVGDRVVFTGDDGPRRARLEARARETGLRVTGSVSRKTAALVTDGSFQGGKAAKAAGLGTRVIHPADFARMLEHVQPGEG
jgi:DNA polymerase-3 subunit epsilon